jgi:glycosidase
MANEFCGGTWQGVVDQLAYIKGMNVGGQEL